jgi:hypothetical protein
LELHRGGGRSRTSGSPGLQEFDSGSWGLSELEAAAQQLATVWVNDIMPHLSGEVSLRRIQARGERVQDDVSFEFVLATPVAGGRPGEAVPFQCAFCVTHLTGLVGRIKLIDTVDLEGGPGTSFCSL